jgi:hypothetical protein
VATGEHFAIAGSLEDQANNAPPTLEAGLHVIFDSVRNGRQPSVAEIEYVPSSPAFTPR